MPDVNAVSAAPTHNTAETLSVEAAGVEFAYRRFGSPAELPLVMLKHFRGNLDNWDPALTDPLAVEREVILVDYPGVGSSTGELSHTIASTARQMIAFADALGLDEIDLLGFSIGGFVPQRDRAGATDPHPPTRPGGGRSEGGAGHARLARRHRRRRPRREQAENLHGFLFQYPTEVAAEVNALLAADGGSH